MKRQIISGLAVSLILTAAAFGTPENAQKEPPVSERQITIRIRDYAQADTSVRQHAEQVAGEILQKTGVNIRWIECPEGSSGTGPCASPMSSLVLILNLLPHSMSDRLHASGGALGVAIERNGSDFGYIASIFYEEAKERARERQVNFGELLGDVIAHELGHLLLGTNSHSGRGLMCAFWSGYQLSLGARGLLEFSDKEIKRIHAAMNARTLAATGASAEPADLSRVASASESFSAGENQ